MARNLYSERYITVGWAWIALNVWRSLSFSANPDINDAIKATRFKELVMNMVGLLHSNWQSRVPLVKASLRLRYCDDRNPDGISMYISSLASS